MTPTTPRTRREPENTPNHTRIAASSDRQFEDRQFEESPLQGRCIWDVEPTDNLSEEMEPFVAGLIGALQAFSRVCCTKVGLQILGRLHFISLKLNRDTATLLIHSLLSFTTSEACSFVNANEMLIFYPLSV
jgi:hypothetical protein